MFMTSISTIWRNYTRSGGRSMVGYENVIMKYMKGFRMHVAVPWYTVDHIYIPVHVKEKNHWVLAVLSSDDRCIHVYDSIRSAGHDAAVRHEIRKLSELLPLYLQSIEFYKKQGIDISSHPRYNKHYICDFLAVEYVDNIPVQPSGSMDCGIYVAAYMEILSNGISVPLDDFDPHLLRSRYGALLWDYGMKKIEAGATSDNEAPQKIVRPRTQYDSIPRILVDS